MKFNQFAAIFILTMTCSIAATTLSAQEDEPDNIDSFLLKRKGLLGKLARNIINDTNGTTTTIRNDLVYMRYKGKIVRNIYIKRLEFGVSMTDTSNQFKNKLIRLSNKLHYNTREQVIRNNLFFNTGDKVIPHLIADNERHLRDLPYIHDADISIKRATRDSVDITIITKDVLSIGGSYRMHNTRKMSVAISEDNIAGLGHKIAFRTLYDHFRDPKFGYGSEYRARNIKGTFIDGYAGYLSYNKNLNTQTQNEEMAYIGLTKPLVNPYMKFIYAFEAALHNTADVYKTDTVYASDHKYKYYNYDAWIGWNTGAFKFIENRENRIRTLVGLRWLQQNFKEVPLKYEDQYFYKYADLRALLTSVTVFRQDFYKTKFVYGFGRNEDIPEGAEISLTGGWTKKAGIERPYLGLTILRNYFAANESYFNYTIKTDGYLRHQKLEDVNLLFNLDFFSRLVNLGKWKVRNFISSGIAHQPNRILNEPLFLQSDFGLREWRNDTVNTGTTRATLKLESVLFTPWNLINFRFAPFLFGNLCLFRSMDEKLIKGTLYTSVGGGLRVRNESLIFETMEAKVYFFPTKNFFGDYFRFEFNTHLRFKYNRRLLERPEFVNVNM